MERIFSDDERIRRAEEIYLRRNNVNNIDFRKIKDPIEKVTDLKSKIVLNLILMVNIAIIIVCVQNKNYIFTEKFIEDANNFFDNSKDCIVFYASQIFNSSSNNNNDEIISEEIDEKSKKIENVSIESIKNNAVQKESSNIEMENNLIDMSSSINEMDEDIKNIKNSYSFINPLEGTVSSLFGNRESNKINVNGYHTGLDIANNKGTPIKCSMQGIVDEISYQGDYGNHLKIRCNNIITLYAHCENIYVEKGQIVAQGQEIATVGDSGNTTGPHLHFEIRVESRFVDPLKILSY